MVDLRIQSKEKSSCLCFFLFLGLLFLFAMCPKPCVHATQVVSVRWCLEREPLGKCSIVKALLLPVN